MQRNRQRIAQPQRPCDQQSDIEARESQRHIRSRGTGDDQAAEAGDQKAEPGDLAPLSCRDPAQAARQDDDQREVGGIEKMLVFPADDELAGDGEERGQGDNHEIVGAEEDAEA